MFRVTQQIDFCFSHRVVDQSGESQHLHGHQGRALISMEAEALNECGMLVDFAGIKRLLRTWIDHELHRSTILHCDDPLVPVLRAQRQPVHVIDVQPTTENIARLIFERTAEFGFPVVEVALWDTPESCATYFRPLSPRMNFTE
ncbi:MAG: 6-pyruvoyl trahydropterin synthase family protein [Planctomycetales bacterium]